MDKQKKIIIGVALVLLLLTVTASGTVTEIMSMDYRKLKGTVPRGISNNNPFNIKISAKDLTIISIYTNQAIKIIIGAIILIMKKLIH